MPGIPNGGGGIPRGNESAIFPVFEPCVNLPPGKANGGGTAGFWPKFGVEED